MYVVHPTPWATSTKQSHPVTIILFKRLQSATSIVASYRLSSPRVILKTIHSLHQGTM